MRTQSDGRTGPRWAWSRNPGLVPGDRNVDVDEEVCRAFDDGPGSFEVLADGLMAVEHRPPSVVDRVDRVHLVQEAREVAGVEQAAVGVEYPAYSLDIGRCRLRADPLWRHSPPVRAWRTPPGPPASGYATGPNDVG
jgi:hypothetical protein